MVYLAEDVKVSGDCLRAEDAANILGDLYHVECFLLQVECTFVDLLKIKKVLDEVLHEDKLSFDCLADSQHLLFFCFVANHVSLN